MRNLVKGLLFLIILNFGVNINGYAQTCDTTITGSGSFDIINGVEACMFNDVDGTVTVKPGGVLRICGQFELSANLYVEPGGHLILAAGSSIGYKGTITITTDGLNPSLFFEGDTSCHAEIYQVGAIQGTVTGNAPGTFEVTESSRIHLSNFFFAWGNQTAGAAQLSRIPAQDLCASAEGCGPTTPVNTDSCDIFLSGVQNYTVVSGEVACLSGDVDGTVTVQDDGILKICGQYLMNATINVEPGGLIKLTSGSSIGYSGVFSLGLNGIDPGVEFVGDPGCHAEIYKAGLSEGIVQSTITGGVATNSPYIHLEGFSYNAFSTIGAGSSSRIPAQDLCTSSENCDPTQITGNTPMCDTSAGTPFFDIDLTASSNESYTSPSVIRGGGSCCALESNCVEFAFIVYSTTDAVEFGIASGTAPSSTIWNLDCDGGHQLGDRVCGLTPGVHHITFCSAGSNPNEYYINTYGSASINQINDKGICPGETNVTLGGSTQNTNSIKWTTTGSGTFSPDENTIGATYIPDVSDNGTIDITLTGYGCDTLSKTSTHTFEASSISAGNDAEICSDNLTLGLSGDATGVSGTAQWLSSGTGNFSPSNNDLSAVYNASATDASNGTVTITLETNGGDCPKLTDQMTLTIVGSKTLDAGSDMSICSSTTQIQLNGTEVGGDPILWERVGGGGNFDNPSSLSPIYTISAADTLAGTFSLRLSSQGSNCIAEADTITIQLLDKVVVGQDAPGTKCPGFTLGGLAQNTTSVLWTTDGTGSFSPNETTLGAIYNPGAGEYGSISFTLTGYGCDTTSKTSTHTLEATTINAGADAEICSDNLTYTLSADITGVSGTPSWSTDGSGSFSPDANTLNATYIPSSADSLNGAVTLSLQTTAGTCPSLTDDIQLDIIKKSLDAGADQQVCSNDNDIQLTGNKIGSDGVLWERIGGSGTFDDSGILNPVYSLNAADISAGLVRIRLSSLGSLCPASPDTLEITVLESPSASAEDIMHEINSGDVQQIQINASGVFPMDITISDGSSTFVESNVSTSPHFFDVNPINNTNYTVQTVTSSNGCSATGGLTSTKVVLLTIPPKVVFPDIHAEHGGAEIQMVAASTSSGLVTYDLIGAECASIDSLGLLTYDCVDTFQVRRIQAATQTHTADTSYATVMVRPAEATLEVESRGVSLQDDTVQIVYSSNFDGEITFEIIGDTNVAKVLSDGNVIPVSTGKVSVLIKAEGSENYNPVYELIDIEVFNSYVDPVAVNDTITVKTGEVGYLNLLDNDYAVTGVLEPELVDVDTLNPGIQSQTFHPSVGYFIVENGELLFNPFEGFVGQSKIGYHVYDDNGNISDIGYVTVIVSPPAAEYPLKANEVMTPNDDGLNDALVIGFSNFNRSNSLVVYDKAGNEVFNQTDYRNDWYGIDKNGEELPIDVYFFNFVEYDTDGEPLKSLKGYIQIIR